MFSELVVCYLFLGGAGAGACFVLALMGLLVPSSALVSRFAYRDAEFSRESGEGGVDRACSVVLRSGAMLPAGTTPAYAKLFTSSFAWALVALGLGAVCLLADAGRPDRAALLLLNPKLSHIAVGAYALATCMVLGFVLMLFWSDAIRRLPLAVLRALCVMLVASAVVAMLYTGLLLYSLSAVPLWNTVWLPILFVLSSTSCGAALVLASAQLSGTVDGFQGVCRRIMTCDVAIVAIEAVVFAVFVASCVGMMVKSGNATEAVGAVSAARLITGDMAPLLWVGFALCGLALPGGLEIVTLRTARLSSWTVLVVVALVLAGGFVMRYCLVQAGAHPLL